MLDQTISAVGNTLAYIVAISVFRNGGDTGEIMKDIHQVSAAVLHKHSSSNIHDTGELHKANKLASLLGNDQSIVRYANTRELYDRISGRFCSQAGSSGLRLRSSTLPLFHLSTVHFSDPRQACYGTSF